MHRHRTQGCHSDELDRYTFALRGAENRDVGAAPVLIHIRLYSSMFCHYNICLSIWVTWVHGLWLKPASWISFWACQIGFWKLWTPGGPESDVSMWPDREAVWLLNAEALCWSNYVTESDTKLSTPCLVSDSVSVTSASHWPESPPHQCQPCSPAYRPVSTFCHDPRCPRCATKYASRDPVTEIIKTKWANHLKSMATIWSFSCKPIFKCS